MATVTTKLTLTSSEALSDSLNLSLTDTLTTVDPAEMSRITVLHSSPTELAAVSTGAHYTYIKILVVLIVNL